MASLVKWDPLHDLLNLQRDVNRIFSGVGLARPSLLTEERTVGMPAMDVFRRGEDLVLRAEMPGIRAEDVDISVTEDVLTVRAERKEEKEVKEEDYLLKETSWGTMERSMRLPQSALIDEIHADYKDGILEITVPKGAPESGKTHKIAIETHGTKELKEHH